jgi:hypothetical protein
LDVMGALCVHSTTALATNAAELLNNKQQQLANGVAPQANQSWF